MIQPCGIRPDLSAIEYWKDALRRIDKERKSLRSDNPPTWKRLQKLEWLQKYAEECLHLAGGRSYCHLADGEESNK